MLSDESGELEPRERRSAARGLLMDAFQGRAKQALDIMGIAALVASGTVFAALASGEHRDSGLPDT